MLTEVTQFVHWVRRRSPTARTWRDYQYDLNLFVSTVGDIPIETVTYRHIDQFVQVQTDKGFQASTINRRLAAVTSLYNYLIIEHPTLTCPVVPYRHVLKSRERQPRPLAPEVVEAFFNTIKDTRDKTMFLLMLCCGLRIAEVADIRLGDLVFDPNGSRLLVRGKGLKERTAYLAPQVEAAIQRYLLERPLATSDHLFLSYKLSGLSTTAIHKRLMRYRDAAEVTLTAHQLRHTFANQLVEAGVPVLTIQKLLGHKWLMTTQGYVAANDKQVQEAFYTAINRLGVWQ